MSWLSHSLGRRVQDVPRELAVNREPYRSFLPLPESPRGPGCPLISKIPLPAPLIFLDEDESAARYARDRRRRLEPSLPAPRAGSQPPIGRGGR